MRSAFKERVIRVASLAPLSLRGVSQCSMRKPRKVKGKASGPSTMTDIKDPIRLIIEIIAFYWIIS